MERFLDLLIALIEQIPWLAAIYIVHTVYDKSQSLHQSKYLVRFELNQKGRANF